MLPDLPGLKRDVQEVLDDYLRKRANEKMGIFSEVPRVFIHEGGRRRIVRADGTVDDSGFKEASAELEIKRSDVPTLTPDARLAMIDKMAEEMATKVSRGIFETLNATLEEAGQTVRTQGKPISLELFFETLDKLDIEFDEDGQPKDLQFVVSPAMAPTLKRLQEEFEANPDLQRRHRELMDRKRMEWRVREAARKLVG